MSGEIKVVVEGKTYYVLESSIKIYPNFYLWGALKSYLNSGQACSEITIEERSGRLFRFVADFLYYGNLPRDTTGKCRIKSEDLINLRSEADFYCLEVLKNEIDDLLNVVMGYGHLGTSYKREVSWKSLIGLDIASCNEGFKSDQQLRSCSHLHKALTTVNQGHVYCAHVTNPAVWQQFSQNAQLVVASKTVSFRCSKNFALIEKLNKQSVEMRWHRDYRPVKMNWAEVCAQLDLPFGCTRLSFVMKSIQVQNGQYNSSVKSGACSRGGVVSTSSNTLSGVESKRRVGSILVVDGAHEGVLVTVVCREHREVFNLMPGHFVVMSDLCGYSWEPVVTGDLVLLHFEVGALLNDSPVLSKTYIPLAAGDFDVRRGTPVEAMPYVHLLCDSLISDTHGLGLLLTNTYTDLEALEPSLLKGLDRDLYEWAVSQAHLISLVRVKRTMRAETWEEQWKGSSKLELGYLRNDTRITQHKKLKFTFVEAGGEPAGVLLDHKRWTSLVNDGVFVSDERWEIDCHALLLSRREGNKAGFEWKV